eukprot:GHVL01016753.1.p3 GENE.GHVL01016753.1~~GHVL01016753.1.p3  ORF type:complete len:251 (+),score=90.18 GHVL01016753.1:67-819(+)
MSEDIWFDSHCHLQFYEKNDIYDIIEKCKKMNISGLACNGCTVQDWEMIGELSTKYNNYIYPQFGLHPWWLSDKPNDWQFQLETVLNKYPNSGVGEIGLDKNINICMNEQKYIFENCIYIAKKYNRPISIHGGGKVWGSILNILNKIFKNSYLPGIILHSYNGPIELIHEFYKKNCYFSISNMIYNIKKIYNIILNIPINRLLIESDSCNKKDIYPYIIINIGNEISKILKNNEISYITTNNAKSIFKNI